MTAASQRMQPSLKDIVAQYRSLTKSFGESIPLSNFGFSLQDTECIFSAFDEDYHISRFFHFTDDVTSQRYSINGFPATHVSIDPEIESIL